MQNVREIFKDVVTRAAEIYGSDIYYYSAHPKEINNKLVRKVKTRAYKYPAIFFFPSIGINRDNPSHFGTLNPVIVVANATKGDYDTDKREAINFIPVIWPICEAFLAALNESEDVWPDGDTNYFNHEMFNHYFYGSNDNEESQKVFDDQLDVTTLEFSNIAIIKEKC